MNQLFDFLGNYKRDLWVSSLASVINKLFDLMPPIITAWFIDSVSGNIPAWITDFFGWSEVSKVIIFLAILVFAIFLFESFFEWVFQRGFMRLAQKVQHDLRIKVYNHIQHREIAYFENQRVGNLMSMLNNDINQLERFLNDSFNTILQLIILVLFAGTALCFVSLPLGLLAMIPIPFILWGSVYYQKKVAPHYKAVREEVGQLNSRLENNISGIQVIKSFTAEGFELQRVEEASEKYREANYKAIRWNTIYVPLIRMVIAVGFVGTLALAAWWVYIGEGGITLGSLALFAMMTQRLLWPVTKLGLVFNEYERARAAARRIFNLLESKNDIKDGGQLQLPAKNPGVKFDQVSFSYLEGQPVLKNIDFNIPGGTSLGIVGLTGAGKTTLIKLLMRFYEVDAGEISLNGQAIKDLKKSTLRKQLALVSQEIYLFHGTIRENIAYGMSDKSLEEVIGAAKRAELHQFIVSLKDGYDSLIGERGIKLSGGQRQRLSLARALLKDAPILILDEATSAVDTETEKAIQSNLSEIMKSKTALIIAHRLSTVRRAEKIIVLGKTNIIESGNHESLLSRKGAYWDLWNVQSGEKIE